MKNVFSQHDLDNPIMKDYCGEECSLEEFKESVLENILNWNEILTADMGEISLAYYYVCFLLTRDTLQLVIENATEKTSVFVKTQIENADNYFRSKMKPKHFHYEVCRSLKGDHYFWITHTLHPLDESIVISPESTRLPSREKLNKLEGSWECLQRMFTGDFEKRILHDYREAQAIDARLEISSFMWRMSPVAIDHKDYTNEYIDSVLKNNPSDYFMNHLLLGILAQFLDLGKFDEQMRNWAITCINSLEIGKEADKRNDYKDLRRIIRLL